MPVTTLTAEFGGRTLTIETGRMALLAGGSVTVRYGDTVLLGTANRSDPRPGLDFFPLTVDFEERMYAAGKIPGGFIKRESRPSEAAILAARRHPGHLCHATDDHAVGPGLRRRFTDVRAMHTDDASCSCHAGLPTFRWQRLLRRR